MEFRGWLANEEESSHGPTEGPGSAKDLDELIQKVTDPVMKNDLERIRLGVVSTNPSFIRGAQNEPFREILSALKQKEQETGLPLRDLFGAMLTGRGNDYERARFGRQVAITGHGVILATIEQYARATDNWELLQLIQKYKDDPSGPNPYWPQQTRMGQKETGN